MKHPPFPPIDACISVTQYGDTIRGTIRLEGFLPLPRFHFGECLKRGAKKFFTTEITENTESEKGFFSVISAHSVVRACGKPTNLDTL